MEMLNATLLVQIANFLIAYYLLRFFLLQPVSGIIQDERAEENRQKRIIKEQQDRIDEQVSLKEKVWRDCRHHFQQNSPALLKASILKDKVQVASYVPSKASVRQMREEVAKIIVSKVDHVS
jgi:hypothetical protein